MRWGAESRPHGRARRGATLLELIVAILLVVVVAAITVPRLAGQLDRLNVHNASDDVMRALGVARTTASVRASYASLVVDAPGGTIRVRCGGAVVFERDLAHLHGVGIASTRDSVTFAPGGMGWGAANTTIVVSRGGSADTIVTSRLGRARRS